MCRKDCIKIINGENGSLLLNFITLSIDVIAVSQIAVQKKLEVLDKNEFI